MDYRLSRRGLGKWTVVGTATVSSAAARAQTDLESMLARKLPPVLRPLIAEAPVELLEVIDAIRTLEREADRLELPASILSPNDLLAIPPDPERLYEAALPRLVALIDRAEDRNVPFADRAGSLLARLHSTQRIVPEALGGTRAPLANRPSRRGILLAMADPPPQVPGLVADELRLPRLPVPVTEPDAALPAIARNLQFDSLRDEYTAYFAGARLRPEHRESAEFHLAMMRKAQPRYAAVGKRAGVPWPFIAAIHGLEASFNFRAHLHNGDYPLNRRTRQVPAGRPSVWLPPTDWESSALDALRVMGFTGQSEWSIPRMLHRLEAFNGFGYRRRGLVTPYLWSFSNLYDRGKFVADGRYDPRARSLQCGGATMLRLLVDAGEIAA